MKTYSKESTAKTQATKLSAKTGDCYYIEPIGDEFAVMSGPEFLLLKMEQQEAAKNAVEQPNSEGVLVVLPFIKETPACLVVLVGDKQRWVDKKGARSYNISQLPGDSPVVKITLTSEYAHAHKDLLAKAA